MGGELQAAIKQPFDLRTAASEAYEKKKCSAPQILDAGVSEL